MKVAVWKRNIFRFLSSRSLIPCRLEVKVVVPIGNGFLTEYSHPYFQHKTWMALPVRQ